MLESEENEIVNITQNDVSLIWIAMVVPIYIDGAFVYVLRVTIFHS